MLNKFIPYGRQAIDQADIEYVINVLQSDWLTQGPSVSKFEDAVAKYCGARYAVAVSNGTAALHLAALAAGFGAGDEVITSPITFVASANCILYAGAQPVFADIDPDNYCIDPIQIESRLSEFSKGVIPVHFAGHPCDMGAISKIARENQLIVIEDAAHAIGASYTIDGKRYRVGSCSHSDMSIFSFHPVKHITTGEGGVVTTNCKDLYEKLLMLRSHGITRDPRLLKRNEGPWYYEMQTFGFNYRITDLQCALGISQLRKLDRFVQRRRDIVKQYNSNFSNDPRFIVPHENQNVFSSYHLYVLRFRSPLRLEIFDYLRQQGVGVNVHYIPVHFHPYYEKNFGDHRGEYPVAEAYYENVVTIPLFPGMTNSDVDYVISKVRTAADMFA